MKLCKYAVVLFAAAVAGALQAEPFKVSFDDDSSFYSMEFRWVKEGGEAVGKVENVAASDHALGGNAVKISHSADLKEWDKFRITPKRQFYTCEPGRKYKVTAWFKGDATGMAQMQMMSEWQKDRKQWFKTISFQVTPEWKLYAFEFTVPAAAPDSTVSNKRFSLIFGLFQNSLKELYVKNVVWEEQI